MTNFTNRLGRRTRARAILLRALVIAAGLVVAACTNAGGRAGY